MGFVLREHTDLPQPRVDQVGKHVVDEPVLATERNRRFGPVRGERHQPLTFAAGENDAQYPRRPHARTIIRSRYQRITLTIVDMPQLVRPTTDVQQSFLAAMAEFRAEGRGTPADRSMIGHENRTYGDTWHTPEGFATYVSELRADALESTPRPEGRVPSTTLWYISGADYLGRLAIR